MAKNTVHNVPDADLADELQLIKTQGWIVISQVRETGGWTIVSVSPDDPEAPGHGASSNTAATVATASGPGPVPGGGTAAAGSADDTLTLARTIFGEARGEPDQGKEAVANVVVNRKNSNKYPNTIAGVCLQKFQFSCWNASDPNSSKIANLQKGSSAVFDTCLGIAQRAVAGSLADRTGGATHYYADSIPAPNWSAPPAVMTVQIGHHRFFTNVA